MASLLNSHSQYSQKLRKHCLCEYSTRSVKKSYHRNNWLVTAATHSSDPKFPQSGDCPKLESPEQKLTRKRPFLFPHFFSSLFHLRTSSLFPSSFIPAELTTGKSLIPDTGAGCLVQTTEPWGGVARTQVCHCTYSVQGPAVVYHRHSS